LKDNVTVLRRCIDVPLLLRDGTRCFPISF